MTIQTRRWSGSIWDILEGIGDAIPGGGGSPTLRVVNAASGAPTSARYAVSINDEPTATYQTPADFYGERGHYANFETNGAGTCQVKVTVTGATITSAIVRPAGLGLTPNIVSGSVLTFNALAVGTYTVVINGDWLNPLYVYANPYETDVPGPGDVEFYYGPGLHNHVTPSGGALGSFWGELRLGANQELYVHRDAFVYGKVWLGPGTANTGPSTANVRAFGYGVIDSTASASTMGPGRPAQVANINGGGIDGLTLIGNRHWGCTTAESVDISYKHTKMLNYYKAGPSGEKGTPDGIDILGSKRVTYDHAFIRAADDCIAIKTAKSGYPGAMPGGAWRGNVEDILVQDSVMHGGQGGNGWDIGYETFNNSTDGTTPLNDPATGTQIDHISNVTYRRSGFVRKTFDPSINYRCAVLGIHSADNTAISNVLYEDVYCDDARDTDAWIWAGSGAWDTYTYGQRGPITGLTYRRVNFRDGNPSPDELHFEGGGGAGQITDVTFEDVYIKGTKVTSTANSSGKWTWNRTNTTTPTFI